MKELAEAARKGGLNFLNDYGMNKVRVNSDAELKDRLVAINRVTKVTKGRPYIYVRCYVVVG